MPRKSYITAKQRDELKIRHKEPQYEGSLTFALKSISRSQCFSLIKYSAEMLKDEQMAKIVALYKSLLAIDREKVTYEALCDAANISYEHFISQVAAASFHLKKNIANFILDQAQQKVLQATVEFAQTEKGSKDREMFHKMTGLLKPDTQVAITNSINSRSLTVVQPGKGIPNFNTIVNESIDAVRLDHLGGGSEKLLSPAKELELEIIDVQSESNEPSS